MNKVHWIMIALLVVGVGVFLMVNSQTNQHAQAPENSQKIKVAASFYPLSYISEKIGGDLVIVENLTPSGAEPHDYEPTPQDLTNVYASQLFIFNGNGLDPWAGDLQKDLESKGVKTLKISNFLDSLESEEEEDHEEESGEEDSDEHKRGLYDPHFWLDPVLVQKQADLIAAELIKVDPANETAYNQNTDDLKKDLARLDQEYKNALAQCKLNEIVTSHAAFGYLAARYGFQQIPISGLSPDEEPSAQTMANVANLARQKNIKYIFFETLVSPKLSQTIANEIGAQSLELNPVEGLTDEDLAQGKNYISIMQHNSENLRTALECR